MCVCVQEYIFFQMCTLLFLCSRRGQQLTVRSGTTRQEDKKRGGRLMFLRFVPFHVVADWCAIMIARHCSSSRFGQVGFLPTPPSPREATTAVQLLASRIHVPHDIVRITAVDRVHLPLPWFCFRVVFTSQSNDSSLSSVGGRFFTCFF